MAGSPSATTTQENLFWQSVMNSTNPVEFEAYLRRFPNGVFSELAQARLAALRAPAGAVPAATGTRVGGAGSSEASGSRVSGAPVPALGAAADGDVRLRPGGVFRDCAECPEMAVLPGGNLAMGRYEVTVGEYRAFASATGGGAGGECITLGEGNGKSWRDPGFPQTDRHPVACVSWDDAQAYVSVAEPRYGCGVSVTDRGGMGTRGRRVAARMRHRADGHLRNVPGRLVWFQRRGSVGHGWESVGVDGGLHAGRLRPPYVARRFLGRRSGVPASRRAGRAPGRFSARHRRFSRVEDAPLAL